MTDTKALLNAIADLPGGVARFASDRGLSPKTVYNKLNEEITSHPLRHDEWKDWVHRCASTGPIQALCNEFGGVFVPTMVAGDSPAHELAAQLATIAKEFSEFLGEVSTSAADSHISDAELARAKKEFYELTAVGAETLARMEAMNSAYHTRMSLLAQEAQDAAEQARRAMGRLA